MDEQVAPTGDAERRTVDDAREIFWLVVLYELFLIFIVGLASIVLWNRGPVQIMYVPAAILEWSFAGAMVGVIHRLAYEKSEPGLRLYTWAIAKPIVGTFMGALVYFLAVAGGLLLGAQPQRDSILWLNVVAFIGGFSDRLSLGLIHQLIAKALGDKGGQD